MDMAFLKATADSSAGPPTVAKAFLMVFLTLVLVMELRARRVTLCRALFKADLWLAKGKLLIAENWRAT
jgi:hypothetical protein